MFTDIHTHNPRPGIPSIVDISGSGDFDLEREGWFSVGVHPKFITDDWHAMVDKLSKALMAHKCKCTAIGECGLDKFAATPIELQKRVFETQICLAKVYLKPIIVHCVRLYNDAIRLLRRQGFQNPVIFHGYNGNETITAQLLKMPNVYFSYSNSSFSTPETSGAKSLPLIPPQRILTETDCNGSADLATTIQNIAEKKEMDASSLQDIVYENFMRIVNYQYPPSY